MKKSELAFSAALVPLDYTALVIAAMTAYEIRFSAISGLRPVTDVLSRHSYFNIILVVAALWVGIFALSGLYAIRSTRRTIDEFATIFMACSTGVLLLIVGIFFQREFFASRFVVLAGWVLAILFVIIERGLVRTIQHIMFSRGIGVHTVVLIGQNGAATDIVSYLSTRPSMGFRIVERADTVDDALLERVAQRIRVSRVDEVILANSSATKEETMKLLDFCNDHHLIFKYTADLFETQSSNIDLQTLAGIPIIEIKRTRLDGWGKILKRVFDIVGATVLLILCAPILLIVGVLIKIDSEGPVIKPLERVGENERNFHLFKFRSMVKNAEAMKEQLMDKNERDGPLFKMKNDPRVTRIGRFIRRTSIDELPQFWNVLRGDMSLVGPRPHEPAEVARYEKHHRKLLSIKPGITGMAQTSGRSDLTFEDEVRLDTFYIEHWSFRLDLQILSKTPWVVLSMRSAV